MSETFIGKLDLPSEEVNLFCATYGKSYVGFRNLDSLAYFVVETYGRDYRKRTTYQKPEGERASSYADYLELSPVEKAEFEKSVGMYLNRH